MPVENPQNTDVSAANPLEGLSEYQLAKESKRRRLLTTGFSASASILSMVAALWFQNQLPSYYSLPAVLLLFGANISAILMLFRWMALPAKEKARRRKNSVLQMLGVGATSEPQRAQR